VPRTVSISLPPDRSAELCRRLQEMEGTLSVRLHRGASAQPEGDLVEADVLDRQMDGVMRLADEAGLGRDSSISVTTSAPTSVVSAGQMRAVVRDTSTSTWEEIELTLGRESTMTPLKVVVMALVGVVAAAGVLTGALHVVIGAMVIAPGFEPLVRIALGVVQRRRSWRDGLLDSARGYGALLVGAAACAALLAAAGTPLPEGGATYHRGSALVSYWTTTTVASVVVSLAAGAAGVLLVVVRRAVLTAGVMIALALVPALTMVAISAVAGDVELLARAGLRWLVDVAAVVVTSLVVLGVRRRVGRSRES
jgi:hypothetical protein